MNKKLVVINLFGGPGCGKSTTAASVFSKLKILGYNVELVTEFAKDMVWERHEHVFHNQLWIFSNQHQRIHRLIGQVDAVITDSPLLLGLVYKDNIPMSIDAWDNMVWSCVSQFDNINYLLTRQKMFNPKGRRHNLKESIDIDIAIENMLSIVQETFDLPYYSLGGNETASYEIVHQFLCKFSQHLTHEPPIETSGCVLCNKTTKMIQGVVYYITPEACLNPRCDKGSVSVRADEYDTVRDYCPACKGTRHWLCPRCNKNVKE